MDAVAELPVSIKAPRIIVSDDSPDRKAGIWIDKQVEIAKSKGVHTQIVEISPPMARALLNRNPNNRRVNDAAVEAYARDMRNGAWEFNGEPVIVSIDGLVNDGQHRLHAIMAADVELTCLLVFGVPRESRATVDQGRIRTIGDILATEGYSDTNHLGAMATHIWQIKNRGTLHVAGRSRATKSEIRGFISDHPNIISSLTFVRRKGVNAIGGASLVGAMHWVFAERSGRKYADEFTIALIEGANLKLGNPILYTRNRLINERGRLRATDKAELIIKAWNAYRANQSVRVFNVTGGKLPKIDR